MSTLKVDNIRHNNATSDAITMASDGTCSARITSAGGGQLSHRNIIINGAMNVAQRGVSYTGTDTYATVDRFYIHKGTVSENPTQEQVDVAAGTTPYSLGFRKAYKITNGNQTLAAGSFMRFRYGIEAQDLANCGWNYTSTSSKITLSFWIKSSVAQNFYVDLQTVDGTAQNFAYETGSLTANTWTKIVKTIPGNSNLTFDNDANQGMFINVNAYMGTNYSASGHTLDTWGAFNTASRIPDMSSTWYTTDDATFELTGVQLEVGDTATSFEHRSYCEELQRCKRYFQIIADGGDNANETLGTAHAWNSVQAELILRWEVEMRDAPDILQGVGTNYYQVTINGVAKYTNQFQKYQFTKRSGMLYNTNFSGLSGGSAYRCKLNHANAYLHLDAEL